MRSRRVNGPTQDLAGFDLEHAALLTPDEERDLLRELSECKRELTSSMPCVEMEATDATGAAAVSRQIANYYSTIAEQGANHARLGGIYLRFKEIRERLAMANLRLVAHIAKRYRDRGISHSDLLQEGLCGLLEAIDRFDVGLGTKLSTYATWWIRQSIQRFVAATAYPVRLSPRHLRQLAQNQTDVNGSMERASRGGNADQHVEGPASADIVRRIHTATQPAVSLDACAGGESRFRYQDIASEPDAEFGTDLDRAEAVRRMMSGLRPREQQVLALRFGLSGGQRLSLSQVGRVLQVSKERVRQIQERAIGKLRETEPAFEVGA